MNKEKEKTLSTKEGASSEKLTAEELESRVAMSVPSQKKNPSPAPYAPGTRYGLMMRANLDPKEEK